MKSKTTQKIKFFFLALLTFLITGSGVIAQCEMGNYPGLNNSSTSFWVTNYYLGSRFSASISGTLTGIGYKGTGSGSGGRLAVYTDVAGNPGTLVAYTNTFTVGSGQVVVPVVTNTAIPAGDYWIVSNRSNSYYDYTDNGVATSNYKYFPWAFNTVPPNTTSWTSYSAPQEDFYLKYACQASALDFDGANDHVNFGTSINSVLDPLNKITVEAWVKPSSTTGLGVIVGNYFTPSNAMQFLLRRDLDEYSFWVDDGTAFKAVSSGAATASPGVWQHVAGVWDGSQLRIYIDGVLKATTTGVTGTSFASCSNYMSLGFNNYNENFAGSIDETRIWTTARTQCEINTYRNCEIPAGATGLLANYHFNQGIEAMANPTINSLTDASGNSFNGTLGNFALTGATSNWISPGGVLSGNVSAAASPTIAIAGASFICSGSSTTFTATGSLNTYTWAAGGPTIDMYAVSPTVTTTYSATGTSTSGCVSNMATITLTVNELPVISANSGTICSGQSFQIIPGGALTYTYSGGTDVVTPTADATYSVSGTDANGCVSSVNAISSVTVNALPTISVNSGAICSGQSFTMVPTGAITYTYSNGTDIVTPTADATYSVSGTDANGCVSSTDAVSSVTVNTLPTISVNSGAICSGQSFTMVPTGAITYTYSNGTDIVTPTADATYSVSGTDANGCVSSTDAVSSVTVNTLPVISVNSGTICSGQSFTMVPTGAITYTYSNGTDVVAPTADATYSVSGTDANGCVSSTDAVSSVTVNTLPVISVNSGAICSGQSFTMVPTGAITYTYSNGTDVVTPSADATYSVSGTDANGCVSSTDAVSSVTVNALPAIIAATNNTLLCTGETATLSVTGAVSYTWSTADNAASIAVTPTTQTTYTVDGTDVNGCTNNTTITQDVSLCTGIASKRVIEAMISVYPNPNSGVFYVELTTNSKVSVMNAIGQTIVNEDMSSGKHELNINDQAHGIYFVKVTQGEAQQVIKIIKE